MCLLKQHPNDWSSNTVSCGKSSSSKLSLLYYKSSPWLQPKRKEDGIDFKSLIGPDVASGHTRTHVTMVPSAAIQEGERKPL